MPIVEVVDIPPTDYLALVWDEFFMRRGRGVSVDAHFPWIGERGVFFVVLRDGAELAGGLAVRPARSRNGRCLAGLVGIVCIRTDYRGQGLSRLLMSAAIDEARARGMDDLLLWTGKPGVYEGFGFRNQDDACSGTVNMVGNRIVPLMPAEKIDFRAAIPPFATNVRRFATAGAAVTVVDMHIVADWEGEDATVAQMLAGLMRGTWQLHTLTGDTLPGFLTQAGGQVQLLPSRLQMILSINERDGPRDPYRLRLLDRV